MSRTTFHFLILFCSIICFSFDFAEQKNHVSHRTLVDEFELLKSQSDSIEVNLPAQVESRQRQLERQSQSNPYTEDTVSLQQAGVIKQDSKPTLDQSARKLLEELEGHQEREPAVRNLWRNREKAPQNQHRRRSR